MDLESESLGLLPSWAVDSAGALLVQIVVAELVGPPVDLEMDVERS